MFDFLNNIWSSWRDSSRKERVSIFFLIVFFGIGLVVFENWTASFRLSKLQKSAEIIETLSRVNGVSEKQISEVVNDVVNQLNKTIGTEVTTRRTVSSASRFWAGMIFWASLGILMFISELKKAKKEWSILLGASVIGMMFSASAMLLPAIAWPWFHFFVYPVLGMLFLFGAIMIFTTKESA